MFCSLEHLLLILPAYDLNLAERHSISASHLWVWLFTFYSLAAPWLPTDRNEFSKTFILYSHYNICNMATTMSAFMVLISTVTTPKVPKMSLRYFFFFLVKRSLEGLLGKGSFHKLFLFPFPYHINKNIFLENQNSIKLFQVWWILFPRKRTLAY